MRDNGRKRAQTKLNTAIQFAGAVERRQSPFSVQDAAIRSPAHPVCADGSAPLDRGIIAFMDRPANQRWLPVAMLVAIVYPVVGIAFAALATSPASHQVVVTWRLAAWLVSAAAFVAHLGYEHFRLRSSPPRAAWHVAVAVALGAFLLAVWVIVHGHWGASGRQSQFAPLALVVFPVVTGVPAFVVALVAGAILDRMRRRSQ